MFYTNQTDKRQALEGEYAPVSTLLALTRMLHLPQS